MTDSDYIDIAMVKKVYNVSADEALDIIQSAECAADSLCRFYLAIGRPATMEEQLVMESAGYAFLISLLRTKPVIP